LGIGDLDYVDPDLTTEVSRGAVARRYVDGSGVDGPILWYEGSTINDWR